MNVAVVFYSLDGNTRLLAETVAGELGADLVELRVQNESRGPVERWVWADREITLPKNLSVAASDVDFNSYDLVVLGTPVWAGGVAPPMKRFLMDREFFHQQFAVMTCYEGRLGRTMSELRSLLVGNEIVTTFEVRQPSRRSQERICTRARTWAQKLEALVIEARDEARGA